MIESCPVCGSVEVEEIGTYRGSHPIFVGLKRDHCCICGMVYGNPMPQDSALEAYNDHYFDSAHGGPPKDRIANAFFSGIAKLRMAYIEAYLQSLRLPVKTLLEFGPGTGFFARNWLDKHPETDYMAVETDMSCYSYLKSIGVVLIEMPPDSTDKFDIVVMSHVLEHVSNPYKFLASATGNLRKGGVLFIEVPCRDWEHKSLDEPHLLFFDKGPMQHLLIKSGFDNIKASYHGLEIDRLRSMFMWRSRLISLRSKLIALGVVKPFARVSSGLEAVIDPLERAVVAPFKAHTETQKPAWWLRAIAVKKR